MQDLAAILATHLLLPGEVQLTFDARRRTDPRTRSGAGSSCGWTRATPC
jgi:hypothetical protein